MAVHPLTLYSVDVILTVLPLYSHILNLQYSSVPRETPVTVLFSAQKSVCTVYALMYHVQEAHMCGGQRTKSFKGVSHRPRAHQTRELTGQ